MIRFRRHSSPLPRALALLAFAGCGCVPGVCSPHLVRLPFVLAQLAPAATDATPGAAGPLQPAERSFILQEIQSGRMLAELSRLAVSQAASSDVRDLAQQLVSDLGGMDRTLEALARRKSVELPIQPTSFGDEYRGLAVQSGSGFDRAFIRRINVASRHQLQVCENVLANAKDPDVRELAGSLLPTLRDHVNKAIELQKSL